MTKSVNIPKWQLGDSRDASCAQHYIYCI